MKKIAFYLLICFVSLTTQAQSIKPLKSYYTDSKDYYGDNLLFVQPVNAVTIIIAMRKKEMILFIMIFLRFFFRTRNNAK